MYIHGLVAYKPQILGDILLSWSTPNNDPMVCTTPQDPNYNGCGYHIPSALGTLAQSYSVWYDEINFTPKERERVDGYMTKKLMEQKYPILSHNTQPCDINNIHSIFEEGTGLDSCGHPRSKVAVGAIMLGFRLENQTLLDKGHDEIYLIHAFINENGIMLQEASRGAQSPNYYWDYSLYHSLLAGIYATVGYDYFEHILPHGAKPFEVLNFQYRLLKDFTLTAPWAHDDKTPGMYQYNTISGLTQEQYEKTYNAKNYYQFGKGDTQFIRAHTEFVKRYMPSIYVKNHKTFFNKKGPENWTNYPTANNANSGIHPYLLYIGNNSAEIKIDEARLQEKVNHQLISELSIFEIDGETFNLALDKGDFIETGPFELERSAEYLKPWQLHKAAVQGSLRMKNSKKINFNSLVFKQADTKEKKLVINVGEMSLERHSDSLQKKCGPKVMEWGWLSFISQTNDIVNARSQQCIHDYFKEANDKGSFELFKAVLSGTDSILDYLKAEVIE